VWSFLAGEFLNLANKVVMRWIRLIPVGYTEIFKLKEQGRPMIFVGWHGHNFINLGVYLRMFGQDSQAVIMVRNDHGGHILAHFARRRWTHISPFCSSKENQCGIPWQGS
jgi:lysophospholipid acyltransferase (LPLAT)-like uncharacterized protein